MDYLAIVLNLAILWGVRWPPWPPPSYGPAVDRAWDSRSEFLGFDSQCWPCVEVSSKLCIPHCHGPPSHNGTWCTDRKLPGEVNSEDMCSHMDIWTLHTFTFCRVRIHVELKLTQRLQKLVYLHIFKDCFMKISFQSLKQHTHCSGNDLSRTSNMCSPSVWSSCCCLSNPIKSNPGTHCTWFKQYLFRDNWETIQVLYKSLLSWALLACCVAGEGGEGWSKAEGIECNRTPQKGISQSVLIR